MVEYKLVLLPEQAVGLFGSHNSLGGDMVSGELARRFFNCQKGTLQIGRSTVEVESLVFRQVNGQNVLVFREHDQETHPPHVS